MIRKEEPCAAFPSPQPYPHLIDLRHHPPLLNRRQQTTLLSSLIEPHCFLLTSMCLFSLEGVHAYI